MNREDKIKYLYLTGSHITKMLIASTFVWKSVICFSNMLVSLLWLQWISCSFTWIFCACFFPSCCLDPFAEANAEDSGAGSKEYVHVRQQQRNGWKSLTTVQRAEERVQLFQDLEGPQKGILLQWYRCSRSRAGPGLLKSLFFILHAAPTFQVYCCMRKIVN